MKTIFIIKTHSFIDVITNSSTELFVCNTDKEVETVRLLLEEKWELFKPLYSTEEYPWTESLSDILEVGVVPKKEQWWVEDYGVKCKQGDIYIKGTSDNSIPYKFFDIIEDLFNATSYHLG